MLLKCPYLNEIKDRKVPLRYYLSPRLFLCPEMWWFSLDHLLTLFFQERLSIFYPLKTFCAKKKICLHVPWVPSPMGEKKIHRIPVLSSQTQPQTATTHLEWLSPPSMRHTHSLQLLFSRWGGKKATWDQGCKPSVPLLTALTCFLHLCL